MGNKTGIYSSEYESIHTAHCGSCSFWLSPPGGSEQSASAAFIKLSEAVHGKPHDGPTVEVRIAVAVDEYGVWGASGWAGATDEYALEDAVGDVDKRAVRSVTWITATLPVPVAQEVKGRVEG